MFFNVKRSFHIFFRTCRFWVRTRLSYWTSSTYSWDWYYSTCNRDVCVWVKMISMQLNSRHIKQIYSFPWKIQYNSNNITTVYIKILKNLCMWVSVHVNNMKQMKLHNTAWPKPLRILYLSRLRWRMRILTMVFHHKLWIT